MCSNFLLYFNNRYKKFVFWIIIVKILFNSDEIIDNFQKLKYINKKKQQHMILKIQINCEIQIVKKIRKKFEKQKKQKKNSKFFVFKKTIKTIFVTIII